MHNTSPSIEIPLFVTLNSDHWLQVPLYTIIFYHHGYYSHLHSKYKCCFCHMFSLFRFKCVYIPIKASTMCPRPCVNDHKCYPSGWVVSAMSRFMRHYCMLCYSLPLLVYHKPQHLMLPVHWNKAQ
jgi:hypothetical protein